MAEAMADLVDSPKRVKLGRARGEARPKKLVHLDKEFGKDMMKTAAGDDDFKCWRCQVLYSSKSYYTWFTSQGEKIICNGCRGSLLQARPKQPKAGQLTKPEQPDVDAEAEAEAEAVVKVKVESTKKKRKEKEREKTTPQEDDEEKPLAEKKTKKKRIRSDAK